MAPSPGHLRGLWACSLLGGALLQPLVEVKPVPTCRLPPPLNHHQRRAVARRARPLPSFRDLPWDLTAAWWTRPTPRFRRRRRQLFPEAASGSERLRRRRGLLGVRVGEASNPGPPAPGTPIHPAIRAAGARERSCRGSSSRASMEVDAPPPQPTRVFCPVPSCPCADPRKTAALGVSALPSPPWLWTALRQGEA